MCCWKEQAIQQSKQSYCFLFRFVFLLSVFVFFYGTKIRSSQQCLCALFPQTILFLFKSKLLIHVKKRDKTKVERFGHRPKHHGWQKSNSISAQTPRTNFQHGGGAVMIWACAYSHRTWILCSFSVNSTIIPNFTVLLNYCDIDAQKRLNVFYLFQEVEESKFKPTSIYNTNLWVIVSRWNSTYQSHCNKKNSF